MQQIQRLTFTNHLFEKQQIVFHNRLAVLVGQHRSGKTEVLKTLFDGFQGKKRDFFVNDQSIQSSDFQVIYLKDHFSLKDEIKFTKTSAFRNHILKKMNKNLLDQEKYQKVSAEIQQLALAMEKVLNEDIATNLKALTNEDVALQFDVHKINLENIIDHLLEIKLFDHANNSTLEEKTLNHFLSRMIIFNILRSAVDEEDEQRPIVVLFDNPELYTTLKTMQQLKKILNELLEKNNFYLVFASNSIDYLMNMECCLENLNWLKDTTIHHFQNNNNILEEAIMNYSFLTQNKYDNLSLYRKDFNHIFHPETDLKQEWQEFYFQNWIYFLRSFYIDHMLLQENNYNFFTLNSNANQLDATYNLSLKNLIVLATFFSKLGFSFQIDSLQTKLNKIDQVFAKTKIKT